MMPRLTIGIPTLGARPDRLTKAIGSALGQSTPARVTVCAQGDHQAIREQVEPWMAHPLFRLIESPAVNLWQNWTFAAESCDTEFFAWLQDDDTVAPHMARRVVMAFDRHPKSAMWLARVGISIADGLSNWWQAAGPMIPMDLTTGGTIEIPSDLVIAGGFFTSWALSPGVAFRWSLQAIDACRRCPQDADLFAERLILAELAGLGMAICDPALVGTWNQHDSNESRFQVAAGKTPVQYETFIRHLSRLVDACPGWQDMIRGWALMVGHEVLGRWLTECVRWEGTTPAFDQAIAIARALNPQAPEFPEPAKAEDVTWEVKGSGCEGTPTMTLCSGSGTLTTRRERRAERRARATSP